MVAMALVVEPAVVRAEAAEPEIPKPVAEPAASADKPARLRFRSKGPACMCLDGLSEAEIAAAERARKRSTEDLPPIIRNP